MKESPKGSVDGVSSSTCVSPLLSELSSCSRSTSSATPLSDPTSVVLGVDELVSLVTLCEVIYSLVHNPI